MAAKGTMIKKAFNAGGKVSGAIVPTYFAASEYNRSREEGNGVASSIARAGMDYALGEALGWKYGLLGVAQAVPAMAVTAYQAIDQMTRNMNAQNKNTPFINTQFGDTQRAYTMRQYGMQMAKQSRYNLEQSLMGNEAQHFRY